MATTMAQDAFGRDMDAFEFQVDHRIARIRSGDMTNVVSAVAWILANVGGEKGRRIVEVVRSNQPDVVVRWIDAAVGAWDEMQAGK